MTPIFIFSLPQPRRFRAWSVSDPRLAPMRTRDPNLDLLRATAILMVIACHVGTRWPSVANGSPVYTAFAFGAYGVDLFFVLSGWLVGGLLWREQTQFGNVEIGRFICRRALRTMPPYFAALLISYLGVHVFKHQRFDWGFLFFIQNYYTAFPFFFVSWSLCVEEHFYLVMPLAAALLARPANRHAAWVFSGLALVPPVCRAFTALPSHVYFGFPSTATHLHMEGLLLGVGAAFVRYRRSDAWPAFRRGASRALLPSLGLTVAAAFLYERLFYDVFGTVVAMFYLCLLVTVVERRALFLAGSRGVFWIASVSYSLYLTHAFTMDAGFRLIARLPPHAAVQLPVFVACIALVGIVFYRLVEVPSLAARHRWMPARGGGRSPLLAPVEPTPTNA